MSKIGDIYVVKDNEHDRYFQLIAIDSTELNSDVIAIFKLKTKGRASATPTDITTSGIEFCVHTTVSAGVRQGLWKKIGTADVGEYSKVLFKGVKYPNDGLPDIESYEANSYHSWIVWHINGEWQQVGADIDRYKDAYLGGIYPPESVIYRIKHHRFEGPAFYGQVR